MRAARSLRLAFPLILFALAPVPVFADDAARISRLETEIQQLRALIDEQSRRIRRLEDDLQRRAGQADPQPRPRPRVDEMRTDAPAATGRCPGTGRRPGTASRLA